MAPPKRSIEEMANKSDSDDDDYSDHPAPRRKSAAKSKTKGKSQPAKKRRRADSEDDDIASDNSDNSSLTEDLSEVESPVEEDVPAAEQNARGLRSRNAAKNRPTYNIDSSGPEDDVEEEDEKPKSPTSKEQKLVTLKVPSLKQQPPGNFLPNRRSTRSTRATSEDLYALTNSGDRMESVGRSTHSPQPETSKETRRASRNTRASKRHAVEDEDAQPDQEMEVIDETMEVSGSQQEVLESDPQVEPQDGDQAADDDEQQNDQDEDGFVPESENGDAKSEEAQDAKDAEANEANDEHEDEEDERPITRRRSRPSRNQQPAEEALPDGEGAGPRRSSRKKLPKDSQGKGDEESDFEPEEDESNDEDEMSEHEPGDSPRKESQTREVEDDSAASRRPGLRKRQTRSAAQSDADGDVADELAEELEDLRDRPRRRMKPEIVYEKPRRSRKDVDYRIIRPDLVLPMEEAENEVTESPSRRARGGGGAWQRTLFPTYGPFGGGGPSAILGPPGAPAAAGGADSDSSDDDGMAHPKNAGPASAVHPGPGPFPPAHAHGSDTVQGLSGTPANLGKVKDKQALADADPLGIDLKVNFDSVGGLQGHIDQLKEMVSLPLLYPEIFQRFHITPPRGVLFHGPPGTGKTLLARALANSVSSEGRKVTFYMRKGADALSKWVGEAERQLRLLFDEARKTQPSIIFFDEIDGKLSRSLIIAVADLSRSGAGEVK